MAGSGALLVMHFFVTRAFLLFGVLLLTIATLVTRGILVAKYRIQMVCVVIVNALVCAVYLYLVISESFEPNGSILAALFGVKCFSLLDNYSTDV